VNELTRQLAQQTEYCASMGAACATLLWRVSRRDDAVESLLSGVSTSAFHTWGAIGEATGGMNPQYVGSGHNTFAVPSNIWYARRLCSRCICTVMYMYIISLFGIVLILYDRML